MLFWFCIAWVGRRYEYFWVGGWISRCILVLFTFGFVCVIFGVCVDLSFELGLTGVGLLICVFICVLALWGS